MIFGNSKAKSRTKFLLDKKQGPIILTGPTGLGKHSFVIEHLKFLDSSVIFPDRSVEQIREVVDLSRYSTLDSKFRSIIINDSHLLSLQAQDALLKVLEESLESSVFIFVCDNRNLLSPALSSRMREEIKWFPLTSEEIKEFALSHPPVDDFALNNCDGRPGFYHVLSNNKDFRNFYNVLTKFFQSETFSFHVPSLISSFRSLTPSQKEVISHLCFKVSERFSSDSKNYERIIEMLNFASKLLKFPNIDAEMHWLSFLAVLFKFVDDSNSDKRGGRVSETEGSSTHS
jgi:replication-associated recombination protein RarA